MECVGRPSEGLFARASCGPLKSTDRASRAVL